MAARKSKATAETPLLPPVKASAPELPAPVEIPREATFQYLGQEWRVLSFDELAAEFPGLAIEALPDFATLLSSQARSWTLVRRIFGIRPALPGMGSNPDDCKLWARDELMAAWQITRAQLQEELNGVRGIIANLLRAPLSQPSPPMGEKEKAPRTELNLAVSPLLTEHHLNIGRAALEDRQWFEGRVLEYKPVLEVPMAKGLARNCLMAEWKIHLLEKEINDPAKCVPGEERWTRLSNAQAKQFESYNKLFAELMDLCPFAARIAGQYDFRGVLSDLTEAIQEYNSRGTTKLVDGMFTALEIKVELRRSVQAPEVRYRAGLVTYINMARANLWDPDWNPLGDGKGKGLSTHTFKVLDQAWAAAAAAVLDEQGAPVPDLQKEGEEGEYAPLVEETK